MSKKGPYSIYLRAFEEGDHILINQWRNDPEIQHLTAGPIRYVSSEMEREWVRQKMMNNTKEMYFAICLNDESHRMIGYTSLNNIDYVNRKVCGGGMVIGDKEHNNGIAVIERGLIIYDYVFNQLNMNRFYASCLTEQKVTIAIMKALLWTEEGCERQSVYKNGKYYDLLRFSLLRDEYYAHLQAGEYELMSIVKRIKKLRKGLM